MSKIQDYNYIRQYINYENSLANKRNPFDYPLSNFPPEYRYFIDKNKFEAFEYYRHFIMKDIIISYDSHLLHQSIKKFVFHPNAEFDKEFINYITDNNIFKKINTRRFIATTFFNNHDAQSNPLSNSMLQAYTKAYEYDEILIVWLYIVCQINNKSFDSILNNLKYPNGSLWKGKIINFIRKQLTNFPFIKRIFETAYATNLRNPIDHNNVYIDDNAEKILSIEDDSVIMSRNEFIKTLFYLQTLQNITISKLFLSQYNNSNIIHDGILVGIVYQPEFKFSPFKLVLYQLYPFFERDNKKKSTIKKVYGEIKNKKILFHSDNTLICELKLEPLLLAWILGHQRNSLEVVPVYPSVIAHDNNIIGEFIATDYGTLVTDETVIRNVQFDLGVFKG